MPIAARGYAHWEGTLQARRAWRVIARQGIRLAFRRRFFKPLLAAALLPAFVFSVAIYIAERIEDFEKMIRSSGKLLQINPEFFRAYFGGEFLLFMMLLIMVRAGAGLIADDLRHNALQLYFARPLGKRDYLSGKLATAAFFLLLLTLVPGIVFLILETVFSGSFRFVAGHPRLVLGVVLDAGLATAFFALLTLLVSALSRSRRYASIVLVAGYFLSDIVFGIFSGIFHRPAFALISIKANLQQAAAWLLGAKPFYDISPVWSIGVLLAVMAAAGIVLGRKVRSVEVVK